MRAVASAMRQRDLRLVLSAGLVSLTGDWVLRIGLAYYVYALTGDTLASALMLLAASIGSRLHASRTLGRAAVVFGLVDLAVFLYPSQYAATWPAFVLMVVVGVPGALMVTSITTLLQRHTADSHRGRVFGALGAVEGIAVVTGTGAAGLLGQTVGIVPILVAQGVGYVLAGTLVAVLLRHAPPTKSAPEEPVAREHRVLSPRPDRSPGTSATVAPRAPGPP